MELCYYNISKISKPFGETIQYKLKVDYNKFNMYNVKSRLRTIELQPEARGNLDLPGNLFSRNTVLIFLGSTIMHLCLSVCLSSIYVKIGNMKRMKSKEW